MWFGLILAVCGSTSTGTSKRGPTLATITAWDCDNPSHTTVYEHASFCTHDRGEKPNTTPTSLNILLVQEVGTHQATGFRCFICHQTRSHICGLWSYEKEVPGLASTEDVQVECKRFAPAYFPHLSIELIIPGTTVQSYVSAGAEYLQNGDTICQGVTWVVTPSVNLPMGCSYCIQRRLIPSSP